MKMTKLRWLWAAFVVIFLFVHLLVGTLAAIATAFYWLLVDRQSPKPPKSDIQESPRKIDTPAPPVPKPVDLVRTTSIDHNRIPGRVKLAHELKNEQEQTSKAIGLVTVTVLFVGFYACYNWYSVPHPRERVVVLFNDSYASHVWTVNGVSDDGWLRDCETGVVRHIVGDYKLYKTKVPVVCSNESHYKEWTATTQKRLSEKWPQGVPIPPDSIVFNELKPTEAK